LDETRNRLHLRGDLPNFSQLLFVKTSLPTAHARIFNFRKVKLLANFKSASTLTGYLFGEQPK
jgi:hypothetical protein